ncbi:MAG: hypothetical protein U0230_07185 [Polyangiales bacterium]
MTLSPEDRRRYLRHLLLAEVGEAGQVCLLAGRFGGRSEEDPRARIVRETYLRRVGITGDATDEAASTDVVLGTSLEVCRFAGRPELEEASAAVLGALSAVETAKTILGLGRALGPLSGIALAEEV